jgi:hypothetical protein
MFDEELALGPELENSQGQLETKKAATSRGVTGLLLLRLLTCLLQRGRTVKVCQEET